MSYIKDFQRQISNQNYTNILQLWEEYCKGDEIDPLELKQILEMMKESKFADAFGKHVDILSSLWDTLKKSETGCAVIRLIIDIQTIDSEELKQLTLDYLTEKYSDQPNFDLKMRLIGMQKAGSFQGAISNFELISHIGEGKFVFHSAGWGIGEISEVSLVREQLSAEFDYAPGKKDLSFELAFKTLIPIPEDHFLAKRFGNPDAFEEEAKKNPTAVIRSLLRDLGPKTAAEIKDEICELIIPADQWTKWWQNARAKLKKDTMIETPKDLHSPFRLRKTEITHEERLKKALENKPDADTFIQMIHAFIRDFPETLKNNDFKKALINKLMEVLAHKEISKAQELQIYFFLEDLSSDIAKPRIAEIVTTMENPSKFIQEIQILSFKKRLLVEIQNHLSTWKSQFLTLLFIIDYSPLRDFILMTLLKEKEDTPLIEKIEKLLHSPSDNPELFVWYFQKIIDSPTLPFSDNEGKSKFFESFLILLSSIENDSAQRDLVKKMLSLLTDDRYALVRKIYQNATIEEVKEFLLLASKCHSLSAHDKKIFQSLAEVVYPALGKGAKEPEYYTGELGDVIWTTEEGYKKAQLRLQEIATKETVDNAKEIEVARSHGDLRENSEFKFALERRDRLQAEVKSLSEQINQARILTKEDITTDKVGVGTIVECKTPEGTSVSYTLLGPWEADPDKNILSYQSKLASKMTNLSVGDKFEFQERNFTITKIRSCL
jgi:transcription elongation factor GreA-like protein/transcription elongation GreA/GreB family factor